MSRLVRSVSRLRAHALTQLAVAGLLSALVGFTLQVTKLSALDSSGRQFDQGTYAGKVGFLAVFGVSKAFANLSVGWLVIRLGYVWTELAGWVLGLAMPLLLILAAAGGGGDGGGDGLGSGASGSGGWRAMLLSNWVLGLQQGLCWSVTVLVMVLILPDTRRGLASGLNETLGYAAVATAAPVYGILESRFVRCGWAAPAAQLSAACRTAFAALATLLSPGSGGAASASVTAEDGNARAPPLPLPALPLLDPHVCTSPDSWEPACLGECECWGYDRLLVAALLVLLPTGLAVTALLLVEPAPNAAAAAAAVTTEVQTAEGEAVVARPWVVSAGEYLPVSESASTEGSEAEAVGRREDGRVGSRDSAAGKGFVAAPAAASSAAATPKQGPAGWLSRLGRLMSYGAARAHAMSYKALPPPEQTETRALLARALQEAGVGPHAGEARAGHDTEAGTGYGHHQQQVTRAPPPRLMPLHFEVATPDPDLATLADRGGGALLRPACREAPARAPSSSGGDWLSTARRFGGAFLQYSWRNPSTAAMCVAGATSNALTSLAWGLLLTWARDVLGVPGPGRNLLTASYSFLKGLVQLLSGAVSDAAGRKGPVMVGLALNAAGLATCACGAGWGGRLLGLGSGGTAAAAAAAAEQRLLVQYGYLMLGGCLMGAGAGVFYPVMPAAVVDHHNDHQHHPQRRHPRFRDVHAEQRHGPDVGSDGEAGGGGEVPDQRLKQKEAASSLSPPEMRPGGPQSYLLGSEASPQQAGGGGDGEHSIAAAMATYRFWRDLGYAVGAMGGPVADLVGVEATLLAAAGACLMVAGVVLLRYEERAPGVAVPVSAARRVERAGRCGGDRRGGA